VFIVELAFDGSPGRLEARPAHRELLRKLHGEGRVLAAGPFADESGAVLIYNVGSPAELDELIEQDAYFRAPGVAIVRRQEWTPVIP
jgi:uncharacterized protein YciI